MYLSLSDYNTSFTGKIGESDFAYIDSNPATSGHRGKYGLGYFSGVFFYLKMPKNLNSNTIVIIPSLFKKIFGTSIASFFLNLNRSRGFFINTGHTDFDRNFAVYTTDKDNAKEILNITTLESILFFKKQMKKPFRISFLYNYFCLAVEEENYLKTKGIPARLFPTKNFSCRFLKNAEINPAQIQELSTIVDLSKSIIETVNLNPTIADSLGSEFDNYIMNEFLKKTLPKILSSKHNIGYYLLLAGAILSIALGLYCIALEGKRILGLFGF